MKKKINIILIIAVLGLWGLVGYRFLRNYFAKEGSTAYHQDTNFASQKIVIQRDTFIMKPLIRDPFLSVGLVNNTTKPIPVNYSHAAQRQQKLPKVKAPAAPWPEIIYYGYIKSGKNTEVAVIKINGQLVRMKKGETKNNFLIKGVYKDSIVIIYYKEKKTFFHS